MRGCCGCAHTHRYVSLCVLIYAAFNVFFISYFTSLWIWFLGARAVELVNTVLMHLFMVALLLLLLLCMNTYTCILTCKYTLTYTLNGWSENQINELFGSKTDFTLINWFIDIYWSCSCSSEDQPFNVKPMNSATQCLETYFWTLHKLFERCTLFHFLIMLIFMSRAQKHFYIFIIYSFGATTCLQ